MRQRLSFQEVADPNTLNWFKALHDRLGELINSIKSIRIELPKVYNVSGKVNVGNVDSLPPVQVTNFPDISPALKSVALGINNMQEALIKAISSQKFEAPSSISVNAPVELQGMNDLLDAQEELKKGFNILIKTMQESKGMTSDKPLQVEVVAEPPRLAPPAVTNININPLNGFIKTTSATVGTTLTTLPTYGQLFNRRAVIIYNNSSNTIYIGGSDVSTTNGIPVPASSYSPILDAGYNLPVYGIASTSNNDVRVLEISKDKGDNVQE